MPPDATEVLAAIQVGLAEVRGELNALAVELRTGAGNVSRDVDRLAQKLRQVEQRTDELEKHRALTRGRAAGLATAASAASTLLALGIVQLAAC